MKTTLTLIWLVATLATHANDKYVETMKKHIEALYTDSTVEAYQSTINALERIASAEKDKWEPSYYMAFGYVMMANIDTDATRKDRYLDQATAAMEKAKALAPQESEVIVMEGFIYMIRLTIDPATRGAQYSGLAYQSFSKAVAVNPGNPRALAMLAQLQYGTAQFFGSPTTEACDTNRKALALFDADKPANPLSPVWGKSVAKAMSLQCEQ